MGYTNKLNWIQILRKEEIRPRRREPTHCPLHFLSPKTTLEGNLYSVRKYLLWYKVEVTSLRNSLRKALLNCNTHKHAPPCLGCVITLEHIDYDSQSALQNKIFSELKMMVHAALRKLKNIWSLNKCILFNLCSCLQTPLHPQSMGIAVFQP